VAVHVGRTRRCSVAGLADAVDAFCEKIAFTPEETRRVFAAARARGLPVKLHADQLSDLSGAALAAEFGALSADHLEYTGEDGVRAMAAAGTVAVLLPAAFYTLRETRLPPIELLRTHGVPIALASDLNPGTSPVLSLRHAMNMACTLFRLTPEAKYLGPVRVVDTQPDAAVCRPVNRLSGPANVLVMPAFHSASISTKMLQELGGATVIGPLLVGLDRPVQIVQLGAKDNQLVNMAALAAFNISG